MSELKCPMYLTAGNFPSIAANTIQVAKMSAVYTQLLPGFEVVALSGLWPLWRRARTDLVELFGLTNPLRVRYLPLLPGQREELFDERYRPPKWFPAVVGRYARLRRAGLVFTRKDATALETIRGNIPTVLETHMPWEHSPLLQTGADLLRHPALRALVVITASLADSFIRAGVPEDKVMIEPDGVDISQFDPHISKRQARADLGMHQNGPLCVYAGHLYEGRGIEDIIEAAALLREIEFLLVGGWPGDVERYRKACRERGVTNVTLIGHVPGARVPLYLSAADVLLMPHSARVYHADRTSPLKMFEYMAAGRPLVASDLPVFRAVLQNNENALLVPPDSPHALAEAISGAFASPEMAELLGRKAREDANKYSWPDRARRIVNKALGKG